MPPSCEKCQQRRQRQGLIRKYGTLELKQKCGRRTKWRTRFFTLEHDMPTFYKSEDAGEAKGSVVISGPSVVASIYLNHRCREHTFTLTLAPQSGCRISTSRMDVCTSMRPYL